MARGNLLYVFLISFCAGVAYATSLKVYSGFIFLLLLLLVGTIIFSKTRKVEWIISSVSTKRLSLYLLIVCIFSGFIIGLFRCSFINKKDYTVLDHSLGQEVSLMGIISDEPMMRDTSVQFTVDVGSTKIITTTDLYPRFEYGDKIAIRGLLVKPEIIKDEVSGRTFNYPQYLAKDGIFYSIRRPKIKLIAHKQGSWLKTKLFIFKQEFLHNIQKSMGEPEAALAGGLIVGAKQSLGKGLENDFRRAGIIHIVVLSGFNITIIAVVIMKLLSFLPRYAAGFFGSVGLILFSILTGGTATVIRSTLMTMILIGARLTRRDYNVMRSLSIAAFIMIFSNPLILLYDPSFELSFLATLGLILFSPYVEGWLNFLPQKLGLKEIIVSTVSTQLFVTPFLLYSMGNLSIVGLLVNVLVLPLIPVTMLFSFLTGILGFVFIPLSLLSGSLGYALLFYELKIVKLFSSLPFASISITYFPFWLLIAIYSIYISLLFIYRKSIKKEPVIVIN